MTILPAPDSILEFLSCGCVKSCDSNRCTCRSNGLKCTDMCKLKDCSNAASNDLEEYGDSSSESDDSGSDSDG
jgi:hypothetical protein